MYLYDDNIILHLPLNNSVWRPLNGIYLQSSRMESIYIGWGERGGGEGVLIEPPLEKRNNGSYFYIAKKWY